MAYSALSTKSVGDPITREDWELLRTNFADHEARIAAGDIPVITVWNDLVEMNSFDVALTGKDYHTVIQNMTITSCYVQIFTKGSSTGAIEIDILKAATLGAAYSSIFSTKPSLTLASASNYDKSTNQVFNSGADCTAGEVLRLDLTQVPATAVLDKILIVCYGELA